LFHRAAKHPGYSLSVDLEHQTVTDEFGLEFHFQVEPFQRENLLRGLDDIGYTLQFEDRISQYEKPRDRSDAGAS
jgi:3-isopropylmalate/(R)-2-methylmalate dehydratase small subunit